MKLSHKLKLIIPRIKWFLRNQQKAIIYSEKIREYHSLAELLKSVELSILEEEKNNQNSEEMKILKIKRDIIKEII